MSLPVTCPTCGAAPEAPCRALTGKIRETHIPRIEALRAHNEETRRAPDQLPGWTSGIRDALVLVRLARADVSASIPVQRLAAHQLDKLTEQLERAIRYGKRMTS